MDTQTLLAAFAQVIRSQDGSEPPACAARMDLYRDGFSGAPGCRARYGALLRALGLPQRTPLNVFCACVTLEEYAQAKLGV